MLKPGQVYRRADISDFKKLKGVIKKIAHGIYYYPEKTVFGDAPPEDEVLVRAFLKCDNFYMASLNAYNSIGVGTTQLYNEKLVYNHNRNGRYILNGRSYYFLKRRFPEKSSHEFLIIDLVNNINLLAEDKQKILNNVTIKVQGMDKDKLIKAVKEYAVARSRSFFKNIL